MHYAQKLSESEVAQMRTLLAQHDSEQKKVTIHDLNRPPREPYRFQKFPLMVYDLTNSYPSHDETRPKANGAGTEVVHVPAKVVSRVVHSEDQLQAAIANGWSESAPDFTEERVEPLSAQQGAQKMETHGVSASDLDTLSKTPMGNQLLVIASGLTPGSLQ